MTFLSITQAVAKNAGIAVPTTTGSNSTDIVKITEFVNEAGKEIARRVDWAALRSTATITGNGTSAAQTIAAGFDRLARGLNVIADSEPVRGSLTSDEWFGLPATEGQPRFYYLINAQIAFWPYLANLDTASVLYQTKNWVSTGEEEMEGDSDTALFDEGLVIAGAIWRWRRHVGKDYSDQMAEFEAMLADRASFDGGVRTP